MASNSNKITLKQREMAELLASPDFTGTITDLCEKCDAALSIRMAYSACL
ncbi:MAG: hypothetical protein VB078_11740 [Clostridiaceae bacterium]|nr:hypothetical protein [Clostridiaceae bacterium]